MTTDHAPGPLADVELAITGMTCASCANRIERKLNKLDGVTATVNYATEKAKVSYPGTVSTDDLLRTIPLFRVGTEFGLRAVTATVAIMALLLVLRHRENIGRILRGEESKLGIKTA